MSMSEPSSEELLLSEGLAGGGAGKAPSAVVPSRRTSFPPPADLRTGGDESGPLHVGPGFSAALLPMTTKLGIRLWDRAWVEAMGKMRREWARTGERGRGRKKGSHQMGTSTPSSE
jgi:hypothetical protein